jgi:large subunit ribosomal protein L3
MSLRLIGKKRGMMQFFDKEGRLVVCSVIHAEPNVVTAIKYKEKDGYKALQLGSCPVAIKQQKRLSKPQRESCKKRKIPLCRVLKESRDVNVENNSVGMEIGVGCFEGVDYVDVSGVSKGKGFQGVMKLHNFAGGPAAHGSGFHRSAGSTGQRSTPGKSFPGGKRASRMGGRSTTVQNLRVVFVDLKKNIILVQGAIPGSKGGVVFVSRAKKKSLTVKE